MILQTWSLQVCLVNELDDSLIHPTSSNILHFRDINFLVRKVKNLEIWCASFECCYGLVKAVWTSGCKCMSGLRHSISSLISEIIQILPDNCISQGFAYSFSIH